MQCGCEAGWDCSFIGCFGYFTSWVTPIGSRVISMHEFDVVRCEVGCWVLGVVLVVEPIVSFWRDEDG